MEIQWPLAPGQNTVAVVGHEGPLYNTNEEPLSGWPAEKARLRLDSCREYLNSVQKIDYSAIAGLVCNSKTDLLLAAHTNLIGDCTAEDGAKERISKAALLGMADILALLSMIARVQSTQSDDSFIESNYRKAVEGSLPTILFMSKLSDEADYALISSIMKWSREDLDILTIQQICCGLEFNESFFEFDENGAAKLKDLSEIHQDIYIENNKPFDFSTSKNEALLGCPFRSKIALLYAAMAEAMIRNGIAKNSFEEYETLDAKINHSLGRGALGEIICIENLERR